MFPSVDQVLDDLGVEAHPILTWPKPHLIIYDVSSYQLSVEVVEAEERKLRVLGFVLYPTRQRFDPNVGHITEYWGYRK